MGGRVTQSGSGPGDLARASRLKKALDSGAPPDFIAPHHPTNGSSTENACAEKSCPVEPLSEVKPKENASGVRLQFFDQMFQAHPDGLSVADSSHQVLWANQKFSQMFGYTTSEIVGQDLEALVVPPERLAESNWVTESLARGERITLETKRRRKDGSLVDVSVSCAPLMLDGKVNGFYAGYHDISDRKRVEALSSALYRVAEKSSSAHDLQQFFTAVHSIVDELMHAKNFYIALYDPASDMLTFPYFVDEQDSAPPSKQLGCGLTDYLIRSGEPLLATPEVLQEMEERGDVERSGSRSLDWMGVPLRVNSHTFGALVVQTYSKNIRYGERDKEILTFVARQVASAVEIKRNELALRRSEARYRSLVQSSVYGIYRSSLEGRFLDVNQALITMLGYESPEEVLLLDPERDIFAQPREHARLIDEFRRTGRLDGIELKWKRKDGGIITVRISGRAVSSADEPADVLEAIAEDVTDRRALEDQFRQAQKMEAVGRLAGGVAHDFNNLLMVISGYAEVMLAQLEPDNLLRDKALAIQQASDRASTLTRQLLAFSRKQLLELKVIDVNAIVADMERLLRPLIGEDVELTTQLAHSVGCTRADAGQLEQVIMNLVVNAKDAMPNGGKICIRTAAVTLDESYRPENTFIKSGPYVMICVSDNGQGMDRETQARIFEPFFTTKEKSKGTGLGLSTVYGIIKQSGGYVFVQSELGRGTVFTIYFPRVDGPSEARGNTPVCTAAVGGSETILLVEDEDSFRQLVRETLEARGYHVLEAGNADAALALAANRADTIHLVITDVVMPGLSGHELIERLVPSRPAMKALYLSGYAQDAFATPLPAEAQKTFLQKPFTLQSLARKVREVLSPTRN